MCHLSTPALIFPKRTQNCRFRLLQPPFMSIWTWHDNDEDISQQSTLLSLTLLGPTMLAHILQSLSYKRFLSTLVRLTKICLWKITYSKNFSHFHPVINSFPSGTSDLSELSGHSTVIDLSFLVQSLEIPNTLQWPGGFPISSHQLS